MPYYIQGGTVKGGAQVYHIAHSIHNSICGIDFVREPPKYPSPPEGYRRCKRCESAFESAIVRCIALGNNTISYFLEAEGIKLSVLEAPPKREGHVISKFDIWKVIKNPNYLDVFVYLDSYDTHKLGIIYSHNMEEHLLTLVPSPETMCSITQRFYGFPLVEGLSVSVNTARITTMVVKAIAADIEERRTAKKERVSPYIQELESVLFEH